MLLGSSRPIPLIYLGRKWTFNWSMTMMMPEPKFSGILYPFNCKWVFWLGDLVWTCLKLLNQSMILKAVYKWTGSRALTSHLSPAIGVSLQTLHFAWCRADSADVSRCMTGIQTMDCGSSFIQSLNTAKSMFGLLPAWRKQTNVAKGWLST